MIVFTQGGVASNPGEAQQGVKGVLVSLSNHDNTGVTEWLWELVSVPIGSALEPGVLGVGATSSFTPDVAYGYGVRLTTLVAGSVVVDERVFGVPDEDGYIIPAFAMSHKAHNFGGQERGWAGDDGTNAPLIDHILKDVGGRVHELESTVDGLTLGAVAVPEANTVFVSKGGNNGTGMRGERTKPFLTIAAALAVAQDGDLVMIGPGTFTEAGLTIPDVANLYIVGSGMGVTTITLSSGRISRTSSSALNQLLFANFSYDENNGTDIRIKGTDAGGYCSSGIGLTFYNIEILTDDNTESNCMTVDEARIVRLIGVKTVANSGRIEIGCTSAAGKVEFRDCVRTGNSESCDMCFFYGMKESGARVAVTVSGCKFYTCNNALSLGPYVDLVVDSGCDFFSCKEVIYAEDADGCMLQVSGLFADSDVLLAPGYGNTLVAKFRGVRELYTLTCDCSEGSTSTVYVSNSSIEILSATINGDGVLNMTTCNSYFDTAGLTYSGYSSSSQIKFFNCVIYSGQVDCIPDPGVTMRGGYTHTDSFTFLNGGQLRIYTNDGRDSTLYPLMAE